MQQAIWDQVMSVIRSSKEFVAALQVPETDAVSNADAMPAEFI